MTVTNTTSAMTTDGEMILLVDSARNIGRIVPDFVTHWIRTVTTILSIINTSGRFPILELFSQNVALRLLLSDYYSQNVSLRLIFSEYNYCDITLRMFLSVY